jgi:hypothetical protein
MRVRVGDRAAAALPRRRGGRLEQRGGRICVDEPRQTEGQGYKTEQRRRVSDPLGTLTTLMHKAGAGLVLVLAGSLAPVLAGDSEDQLLRQRRR